MADLLEAMERLWFHQIILVPEPTTSLLLVTKNLTKQPLAHNCMDSPSSSGLSLDTPQSRSLLYKDDSDIDRVDEECEEEEEGPTNKRPTRSNLTARRARSHSSLPSTEARKRPKRLEKSMSFRSFQELELEELKGFMDLGFKFNTEDLNPRLLRVVPGLQRLGLGLGLSPTKAQEGETLFEEEEEEEEEEDEDEDDDDDERVGVMRPYLSEAWLIRKPDSPLLNLRVPRVTAASEMKKHLRCWARTVAYVIQQES